MPRKILIIDDDPDLRHLAEIRLKHAGYQVLSAANGESGLELLRAERPPVIVLDLMMPRMHGYSVCQEIRGDPELRHTYIIAASAKRYPVDIKKALELGANTYLMKPYDLEELVEKVGEAFEAVETRGVEGKSLSFLVKFWGTRGSIATPGRSTLRYGGNTSCVEMRRGDVIFMLDCGTGAREMGLALEREFGDKPLEVHIFVSHTHWDHIQGFPFFLPAYMPGSRIHIYSLRGADKSLEKVFTGQMDASYFPVEIGDLSSRLEFHELAGPIEVGDVRVSHFALNHPGMAIGFRFEADNKSVVYLTDHEPYCRLAGENDLNRKLDREVDEFARGASLYIREAQYTEEEYPIKRGWGHSTWKDALESAHAAESPRLCLFHHDPMRDDDALDRVLASCWKYMGMRAMKFECVMAADGMEMRV
jgi:phosphoribosyl 1,2-cyclic phosphodiesterase/CheY-like chemotaxis protein